MTILPHSSIDLACTSLFCKLALSVASVSIEAQLKDFVQFFHIFLKTLPSEGTRRYLSKQGEVIRFSRSMLDARLQQDAPLVFITDYGVPADTLWSMMNATIYSVTRKKDSRIRNRPVVCISCSKENFVHWVSRLSYTL